MFKPTIGLEIHSELKTKSKMFCSCKNDPQEKRPNVNICPVCTAQPGALPVINREAIKMVIKAGLALNCQIAEYSKFDRKNYFYPDLPKGYQISQYDNPLCEKGFLDIDGKKIRVTRIHLEEDTGRLAHPGRDLKGEGDDNYSLVDFNRAGVPLMELVTEPDIETGEEARKFAEEFQLILRYLNISDADMEKGQFRVEVNISLSESDKLGTKVEIKNLNSFRAVEGAVDYEIKRQKEILSGGGEIIQETRGWDSEKKITISQRKKEEAHDYRYFPEPDLLSFHLEEEFIDSLKKEIPELPAERKKRIEDEYNLEGKIAQIFTSNKKLGEYFEKVMSELREWVKNVETKDSVNEKEFSKLSKLAANYLISDLQGLLAGQEIKDDFIVTPENFAEFVSLIYEGKISSKMAKILLKEMFLTGKDPSEIVKEKGLIQIVNESEIEEIAKEVISENEKAVADYKNGKENALQFLVGQVMAKTKGRAKPDIIKDLFKNILS